MTFLHQLKLAPVRLGWIVTNQIKALKYAKEIREYKSLAELREKTVQNILAEEKIDQNSDELKLLKIKLGILNELL